MTKTAENGKVCVAMITTAHGVRGLVKVKSYTKQARDFASYGALSDESDKRSFKAEIVGQTGDVFLVRLDGISDRTAAEALRGVKLFDIDFGNNRIGKRQKIRQASDFQHIARAEVVHTFDFTEDFAVRRFGGHADKVGIIELVV